MKFSVIAPEKPLEFDSLQHSATCQSSRSEIEPSGSRSFGKPRGSLMTPENSRTSRSMKAMINSGSTTSELLSPQNSTSMKSMINTGSSTSGLLSIENNFSFFSNKQSVREACHTALSFDNLEERKLCRGIPLSAVLHRGAYMLSRNNGCEDNYEISRPVDTLDYFLSHNWVVSRLRKYLALSLYFNLGCATMAAFITAALCFYLQASGTIPLLLNDVTLMGVDSYVSTPSKLGISVHLVTTPVFLIVLFFKHELFSCARCSSLVFLDKCCIHQTDQELKRRGIMKLGAFLANSSRMLIIYSDMYLQKLWTVYEVACFLSRRDETSIEVVHASTAPRFLLALVSLYIGVFFLLVPRVSPLALWACLLLLSSLTYATLAREGHRTLASTWERARDFKVENAKCAEESDRQPIEKNIEAFMKDNKLVDWESSRLDALQTFNQLVQTHVFQSLRANLGTAPVPHTWIVLVISLTSGAHHLDILSSILYEFGRPQVKVNFYCSSVLALVINFFHVPLSAELIVWITSHLTHLTGWKEWLLIAVSSVSSCLFFLLLSGIARFLHDRYEASIVLACAFWIFSLGPVFVILYFQRLRLKENKRQSHQRTISLRQSFRRSATTGSLATAGGSNGERSEKLDLMSVIMSASNSTSRITPTSTQDCGS